MALYSRWSGSDWMKSVSGVVITVLIVGLGNSTAVTDSVEVERFLIKVLCSRFGCEKALEADANRLNEQATSAPSNFMLVLNVGVL